MEIRLVHRLNREGDTIEFWFVVIEGGVETIFQTWAEVETYLIQKESE
jgi:hypothetical protein